MDRNTQWAALLTVVGIVALALAAATLPSTVSTDETGAEGTNASGGGILPLDRDVEPVGLDLEPPPWLVAGLTLLAVAAAIYYFIAEPGEAIANAIVVALVVGVLMLLLFLLTELLDGLSGGSGGGDGLFGRSGGPARGGEVVPSTLDPSLLVAAVAVGLVLLAAAATLYSASGDAAAGDDAAAAADGGSGDAVAGVGRAAGRAADRIEARADTDNEVYRAWQEMATLVGGDRPETSTPGEFADDAVAAGMDPADVEELTRLFEEVRYGDAPPTDEREQRAVRTLRAIEDAYAGAEEEWG